MSTNADTNKLYKHLTTLIGLSATGKAARPYSREARFSLGTTSDHNEFFVIIHRTNARAVSGTDVNLVDSTER